MFVIYCWSEAITQLTLYQSMCQSEPPRDLYTSEVDKWFFGQGGQAVRVFERNV